MRGQRVAQAAITAAERHRLGRSDPRYGTWAPIRREVFTPFTPVKTDVYEPGANEVGGTLGVRPVRSAADDGRPAPSVTVAGLGAAGPDLVGDRMAALLGAPGRTYLRTAQRPAATRAERAPTSTTLYAAAGDLGRGLRRRRRGPGRHGRGRRAEPVMLHRAPGRPWSPSAVDFARPRHVTVVPAPSFLDFAWAALGIDRVRRACAWSTQGASPRSRRERGPFLVAQCWTRHRAEVKLSAADDDAAADGLPAPGAAAPPGAAEDEVVDRGSSWSELDRSLEPDHPDLALRARASRCGTPSRPAEAVARLRRADGQPCTSSAPGTGCRRTRRWMPRLVSKSATEILGRALVGGGRRRRRRRRRLRSPRGGAGRPLVPDRLPHAPGRRGRHFDLGGVADTVHDRASSTAPPCLRRRRHGPRGGGPLQLGGHQEDREGQASVTEGIPASCGAHAHEQAGRKGRRWGSKPGATRAALRSSRTWPGSPALAARAQPQADDPLADDSARHRACRGRASLRRRDVARRVGIDAEQPCARRSALSPAAGDPRGRRRPEPGTGNH